MAATSPPPCDSRKLSFGTPHCARRRTPLDFSATQESSMSAVAELDTAPQTIEPTVNYILNDGAEIFNYTGGPGSTETKSGGTPDPHRGRMRHGRPPVGGVKVE